VPRVQEARVHDIEEPFERIPNLDLTCGQLRGRGLIDGNAPKTVDLTNQLGAPLRISSDVDEQLPGCRLLSIS